MDTHGRQSLSSAPAKVVVDRPRPGQPYKGRVFVAVHAHLQDVPYYAGGLCARLMLEGYTGYLVRTTNDEKYGGRTIAQNILSNEQEHLRMAKALGFKDTIDLYYRAHRMNEISPVEIRGRLILILRMLKADTVLSFLPTGEEDSDHHATGRAVEDACDMAASESDFQEHLEAGFGPQSVVERYYFHTHAGQPFNRVVDIGPQVDKKVDAMVECQSQGGGGLGAELRARLAKERKRLPVLGGDDRTANREYVRQFLLDEHQEYGRPYKLSYAERFWYVDRHPPTKTKVDEYVAKNAVGI